jgi:hypothetical protein
MRLNHLNNHAAASAFLLGEADLNSKNAHLSVNATECEPIGQIASYFRAAFQEGKGEVAVCLHKVHRYVDSGRKAGATIRDTKSEPQWVFPEDGSESPAFRHRPVPARKMLTASPSHCGVEFVRALSDVQQRNFARLMAKKPRFHIFPQE